MTIYNLNAMKGIQNLNRIGLNRNMDMRGYGKAIEEVDDIHVKFKGLYYIYPKFQKLNIVFFLY